jgi:hypothetical protein
MYHNEINFKVVIIFNLTGSKQNPVAIFVVVVVEFSRQRVSYIHNQVGNE